jgi:hypothetical protein
MSRVVAIVATVLLIVVACGDDDDSATVDTRATFAQTSTSPESTRVGAPTTESAAPTSSSPNTPQPTPASSGPSTPLSTAATTAPTTPAPVDACANDFIERQEEVVEMGSGIRGYSPVGAHDRLPCGAQIKISGRGSARALLPPDGDCTIGQVDAGTAFFASRPSDDILLLVSQGVATCAIQGSAVSICGLGVVAKPQGTSQGTFTCSRQTASVQVMSGAFLIRGQIYKPGQVYSTEPQVVCGDNCPTTPQTATTTLPLTTSSPPTTTTPAPTTATVASTTTTAGSPTSTEAASTAT